MGVKGWWGISCGGGHRLVAVKGWWGQGVGVKMGKGVVGV